MDEKYAILLNKKLPNVIYDETHRLVKLWEHREYYGFLFQLKDVYEITLKFYTLVGCSYLKHVNPQNKLYNALVSTKLSLGNWVNLAQKLLKDDSIRNCEDLYYILKNILRFYDKEQVCHWRNEKIGHGALGFIQSEEELDELSCRLNNLCQLYEKLLPYITQMLFVEKDEKVICTIAEDCFLLEPFILLQDNHRYFFDSYSQQSSNSFVLDYHYGRKKESFIEFFVNLYKTTKGAINPTVNVASNIYESHVDDFLREFKRSQDYIFPQFLKEAIDKTVTNYKKGVFLLRMERGTGKTAFAYYFDCLAHRPSNEFYDIESRTYYCSDMQIRGINDFISKINKSYRSSFSHEYVIEALDESLPKIRLQSTCRQEDFANLLNFYKSYYEEKHCKDSLFMILDGVDEVSNQNKDFFSFIPDASLLADGVYIFLFARRDNEDISHFTKQSLSKIKFDAVLDFDKEFNRSAIETYVKKRLSRDKLTGEQIRNVADICENRFSHANLLTSLISSSAIDLGDVGSWTTKSDIFINYLNALRRAYGDKLFAKAQIILTLLAISPIPLSIREIADIVGDYDVTLELMGYLNDLKPIINVNREFNEEGIVFDNMVWIDEFTRNYKTEIGCLAEDFLREIENYPLEVWDILNNPYRAREFEVPPSYFIFKVATLIPTIERFDLDLDISEKTLYKMRLIMEESDHKILSQKFSILFQYFLDYYIDFRKNHNMEPSPIEQATALCALNYCHLRRDYFEQSINDVTEAIEYLSKFDEYELPQRNYWLGHAYISRAITKMALKQKNLNDVLEDYNIGIQWHSRLRCFVDREMFSRGYICRSRVYRKLGMYDEAMSDLNSALQIRKELYETSRLVKIEDYAVIYHDLANLSRAQGKRDSAFKQYSEAIDLYEKNDSMLADKDQVVFAYFDFAEFLFECGDYPGAYRYVDLCVSTKEKLLLNAQNGNNRDLLIFTLYKAAFAYKIGSVDTEKILNRALEIYEKNKAILDDRYYNLIMLNKYILTREENFLQNALLLNKMERKTHLGICKNAVFDQDIQDERVFTILDSVLSE